MNVDIEHHGEDGHRAWTLQVHSGFVGGSVHLGESGGAFVVSAISVLEEVSDFDPAVGAVVLTMISMADRL